MAKIINTEKFRVFILIVLKIKRKTVSKEKTIVFFYEVFVNERAIQKGN